jgi:hypothetical protein
MVKIMFNRSTNKLCATIILLLLVLFNFTNISAQSYNKTSTFRGYWQINANAGTSLFFGDIKQYKFAPVSNHENEWRYGGGLMLGKRISPVLGIRGQFVYGQLSGTRRSWNMFFESNYIEFNLNASVSVRNIVRKYNSKQIWDAYVILGLGLTNFNTEVKDLSTKKVTKKVGYGSGKSFAGRSLQGMAMGGLGFDLKVTSRVNLNLETANRILNTDELDGFTNDFKYDVYNYTTFGISYKFGGATPSKIKKSDDYSYFETQSKPKSRDNTITQTEYDYNPHKPLEPPRVDILTIESEVVAKPVLPPVEEKVVKYVPIEVIEVTPAVIEETVFSPGIEYRVQIRAKYGNAISIQNLSNTYNIPLNEIRENMYNGFYIYTVGSFNTYEEARERRNQLRSRNGISDSFIVAFRNGKRLSKLPQ